MVRQILAFVGVALAVGACAALDTTGTPRRLDTFAHRVATSEVVLLWNCVQPTAGTLRIEGVAQNPWQAQPIGYLELQAVGVDARGRQTAEARGKARDLQIFTNERSPFHLDLRTTGTEVRVDLYYQYLFNPEWESGALLLAGPSVVGPQRYAQSTNIFMVRDACSPNQHRAH